MIHLKTLKVKIPNISVRSVNTSNFINNSYDFMLLLNFHNFLINFDIHYTFIKAIHIEIHIKSTKYEKNFENYSESGRFYA